MRIIAVAITSVLFTIVGTASLQAQVVNNNPSDVKETSFGIRGGLTLYSIETEVSGGFFGSASETSGTKIGLAAGIFAEIPFNNVFSFQPELLLVQKGGSDSGDFSDEDDFFGDGESSDSESLTFNYLDLPLLARANIPLDRDFSPYVVAGPSIGYLLSVSASSGDDEDIDEFFKSFNLGFIIGAGVEFGNLSVDLRYDIGLTNIFDDSFFEEEFDDEFDDGFDDFFDDFFDGIDFSQKTSGLIISVGYRF